MILLTPPQAVPNETERLLDFLNRWPGARIHLRKPDFSEDDFLSYLKKVVKKVPPRFISVHQHHRPARDLGIFGWHLTGRDEGLKNESPFSGILYSCSCHGLEEFNALDSRYAYGFLSPVFPSISKPGYGVETDWKTLLCQRTNFRTELVGLGGLNVQDWTAVRDMGFDDMALLGSYWNE